MSANVGTPDRIVRLVIAVVAVIVGVQAGGGLAIALYVVAAVMVLTALVRFCPLYRIFGMSTCKR